MTPTYFFRVKAGPPLTARKTALRLDLEDCFSLGGQGGQGSSLSIYLRSDIYKNRENIYIPFVGNRERDTPAHPGQPFTAVSLRRAESPPTAKTTKNSFLKYPGSPGPPMPELDFS
jgi:hypothetical protein